jgi:hypothetical protein
MYFFMVVTTRLNDGAPACGPFGADVFPVEMWLHGAVDLRRLHPAVGHWSVRAKGSVRHRAEWFRAYGAVGSLKEAASW